MDKNITYIGLTDVLDEIPKPVFNNNVVHTDYSITCEYSGIVQRIKTSIEIQECMDSSKCFRIDNALWDTGASSSCISECLARKLGLHPIGTGVGISSTGRQDILYYIVDIYLSRNVICKGVQIAGFALECHDVDFIIGMDVLSKGNFSIINQEGKTKMIFEMK